MNRILLNFIARLLSVVIAWNTFGSVALANPANTLSSSEISEFSSSDDQFGSWFTSQDENSEKPYIVFEEFVTEEENQKNENDPDPGAGFIREYLPFIPLSEVAFFSASRLHLLSFHTEAIYIRYCTLKIPLIA